ncbi:hypothetical protein [Prochlorothrix hollandica]|nr:hypothetical protein [Prochlorothrix hollandica]
MNILPQRNLNPPIETDAVVIQCQRLLHQSFIVIIQGVTGE